MTTVRLAARLDRVTARIRVPEPDYRVDLNLLTGAEADRLVMLGYAFLADTATPNETEELGCLLRASLTLTSDGRVPPPFPVPISLQMYWRFQKFADTGFSLPSGNYTFSRLSFGDRVRLMELCKQYGWEPLAEVICIAPLAEWDDGDLEELSRLLWQATSEIERDMWERRDHHLAAMG